MYEVVNKWLFYCLCLYSVKSYGAILRVGNPLQWKLSQPFLQYVRHSGVDQFIQHYKRCKGVESPLFVWGDEIEYGIFRKNQKHNFDLALNASKIRDNLISYEIQCSDLPIGCEWQPEYGSWMVEAVPRSPFGSYVSDLLNVEKSMQLRRKRLHSFLQKNEIAPTITTFPMLGVPGYDHSRNILGEVSNSVYVSDAVINPHPRFAALTRNIRMRKGRNVDIVIPSDTSDNAESIHMDAMAFGMGCCCVQVTMQLHNEAESRYLHDQLLVLAPILQALSASTPFFKGNIAATDTRWDVISQAVDDRTREEIGLPLDDECRKCNNHFATDKNNWTIRHKTSYKENNINNQNDCSGSAEFNATDALRNKRLSRSRYSASCLYLSCPETAEELSSLKKLHDIPVDIDEMLFQRLVMNNVDEVLARYIAHLFIRDPLVIFDDAIALNNATHLDHFENIQSTNWRSLRWKPPSLEVGQVFHNLSKSNNMDNQFDDSDNQNIQKGSNRKTTYASRSGEVLELNDDDAAFDNDALLLTEQQRNILVCDRAKLDSFVNINETVGRNMLLSTVYSNENNETMRATLKQVWPFFNNAFAKRFDNIRDDHINYNILDVNQTINNNTINVSKRNSSIFETLQRVGPGWRVEFRPLEVQLTDFENSAYAILVVLISRMLIHQKHSLYLPMSLVEENMKRAAKKDAVTSQRFYFRRNCLSPSLLNSIPCLDELDIVELTMDEIINGEQPSKYISHSSNSSDNAHFIDNETDVMHKVVPFPGLLSLIWKYLSSVGCDETTELSSALIPYLTLISKRATGEIPTTARYLRDFVTSAYKQVLCETKVNITDGNQSTHLTPEIANLLLQHCDDIGMGRFPPLHLCHHSNNNTSSDEMVEDVRNYADNFPIQNLDLLDEEDLMFTNVTYFVKPISSSLPLHLETNDAAETTIDQNKNKLNLFVGSVRSWWHKGPWRILRRSKDEKLRF